MKTQFRLIKPSVVYRIAKGKPETISNVKMSDELALQFLAINPERIKLFAEVSESWQKDISDFMPDVDAPVDERRAEFEALKLSDLRELYPEIKATAKPDFIDKILAAKE